MSRIGLWWERAFWVIPLLGLLCAVVLSELASALDAAVFDEPGSGIISDAAATTLLAAVGGAMVTFTGFVFSLVLLLLQFGSSQYSPRTVAFFLRARSTQVILAIFLMTALFCFLTLVGVGAAGRVEFSASGSVIVAVVLLVSSLVAFIALMHLVSKRIRIDAVVTSLGVESRAAVLRTLARVPRIATLAPEGSIGADDAERHLVRYVGRSGQIVAVDWRRLYRIARRHRLTVDVMLRVGDGLSPGRAVAWASGDGRWDSALSRCFVVDGERSLGRDPTYGLRILVDIALKALSPAVNDPTTAVRAIDEIDGVLRVGSALPLAATRIHVADPDGRCSVTVPITTWPDAVDLAVHEVRLAGLRQPQVTRRLVALLSDLARDLPPEQAAPVQRQLDVLLVELADSLSPEELRFATSPDRQGIGGTTLPDTADEPPSAALPVPPMQPEHSAG